MRQSGKVALGGVMGAVALMCLLGTVFPYATLALPAMAGIALAPVALEAGIGWGWLVYGAVALLNLLITPSMEAKVMFVAFFGYYPILRLSLNRLRPPTAWVVRLAVFNVAAVASYWLMIKVFGMEADTFELFGINLPLAFLALGNVTFVIYELALAQLEDVYRRIWQPRLMRLFHR